MNLARLLALLKPKPKPRPIYVDGIIVGYDDGLPNSVKIDKAKLQAALTKYGRIDHMVPWSWLHEMDRLVYRRAFNMTMEAAMTKDTYADKAIFTVYGFPSGVSTGGAYLEAREQDTGAYDRSYYYVRQEPAAATADRKLVKRVGGTESIIGTEAADYTDWWQTGVKLQCLGTTIKVSAIVEPESGWGWWHNPLETLLYGTQWTDVITATDTGLASGRFGITNHWDTYHYGHGTTALTYMFSDWVSWEMTFILDAASPPTQEPIAFFEVPITGSGKMPNRDVGIYDDEDVKAQVDPFRPIMPEEIVEIEKPVPSIVKRKVEVLKKKGWSDEEIKTFMPEDFPVERINRLAMTWSALIPTDKSGKPVNGTAIVRVFGGSPEYVHPIEKRIQALKEMRGVRMLKREEAIDLALKMDDKLHIHDLVPCTKHDLGGKCFREYRDWRISTVGDKPEHADTDIRKRYVKEGKGW